MAIPSPSGPTVSASLTRTRARPPRSLRFSFPVGTRLRRTCLGVSSRLSSPEPSGDLQYELHHGFASERRNGSPVFVTLPADAVTRAGQVRRRKALAQTFRALAAAGVEGLVMEVWWGVVERDAPGAYEWGPYLEIVTLARRLGLKVRAVMAFHQCGSGPDDPNWIPLPKWVCEEMDKDPDLTYSDRFGRRNSEYISLGCDLLPVLRGRTPVQAYSDFMRNFRESFKTFFGLTITGVQVGMGPSGELSYPSSPSQKLEWACHSLELGEFQCYDKYILALLNARAREIGKEEWGNGSPTCAANLMPDREQTEFISSSSLWNTPYGKFFLEWYSAMLLIHGERICKEAETIFRGTKINLSAKVGGIQWHYGTKSHQSELTPGYYNTTIRDWYLPIARMFGRYGFTLCCTGFEMKDAEEKKINPVSSPEGFLKQLLFAAKICGLPLHGENSTSSLDDKSFQQVLKTSKSYSDGAVKPSFTFNFVRMDKNLFEYHNWVHFTRFVKQMSDPGIFQAKLRFLGGNIGLSSLSCTMKVGAAFTR